MKYVKMLGIVAALASLMAVIVASSASATELTCKNEKGETIVCPVGTTITASSENGKEGKEPVTLHPPIGDIECTASSVDGKIENAGSPTTTPSGKIKEEKTEGKPTDWGLSFSGCNAEVVVLNGGSLEIHTRLNEKGEQVPNNGTLTSSNAEVTVTFLGFHCIFKTSNTDIGTVTGSAVTGGNATLDIEANIPRTGGRSGAFCGSTAQWTGHYVVESPSPLNVD